MQGWMEAFVIVASLAIVLQMVILLAMYMQFRTLSQKVERISEDLNSKLGPILVRANRILEDSQSRIESIMGDSAEIVRIARNQAQKVDRVFTETVERLRLQVVRADHIVTGTLEVLEDAGSRVRKTLLGPVQQVSAVLKAIRTGIDFIRGQRRPADSSPAPQDEELFI
ncbi:MAG: hypothetical protein ACRD50_09215 [Candidatus Acidiferrales bacterium]